MDTINLFKEMKNDLIFVGCMLAIAVGFLVLSACQTTEKPVPAPGDLRCTGLIIEGKASKAELNEQDLWTIEEAKKQCFIRFPNNSPCLKKVKITVDDAKGIYDYKITCGPSAN